MMNAWRCGRILLFCFAQVAVLLAGGCTANPARDGALASNGFSDRFWQAAETAFYDHGTWPLLLGAAVVRVTPYDAKIADYAMKHKPMFSNKDNAAQTTDTLRSFNDALALSTALAVKEGWEDKGERVLTEGAALFSTRLVTTQMNERVNREYPDGTGNDSFGSHHAASPFAAAALTRRNMASIDMPGWAASGINITSYAAASASSWGRIEMGLHYPSDQLASAAVGNFIAILFHDTFVSENIQFNLSVLPKWSYLTLRMPF